MERAEVSPGISEKDESVHADFDSGRNFSGALFGWEVKDVSRHEESHGVTE